MLSLEPLFCPCCTPALLHTLAQTNLTGFSQQMFWLGTGALSLAIQRESAPGRSLPPAPSSAPIDPPIMTINQQGMG